MELFFEILKTIFIGIVEGITEWLPVSSTGHMIIAEDFLSLNQGEAFWNMFLVVIQLGAILAVVVLYFGRLNPFSPKKTTAEKKTCYSLWGKILVASVPAAALGLLLDDFLEAHLMTPPVVAAALIVYGIAFIIIEKVKKNSTPACTQVEDITYLSALKIGCFQILSLVPGTSRSGSTILGGMLTGVARPAGAEFSFFLAIPVMLGASGLKLLKYVLEVGFSFSAQQLLILAVGVTVAFFVSLVSIKALVSFVRRHSFSVFGYYRIVLGVIVLGYFFLTR